MSAVDPAVVALARGARAPHCSGFVVSSRLVVTAAHCLPADVIVLGENAARPVRTFPVVRVWRGRGDVAALETREALQIEPLSLSPAPQRGALRAVGYGRSLMRRSVAFTPPVLPCDERRARSIGCRVGAELVVLPGDDGDTCWGDSGGPLLATDETGREFVLALTSRSVRGVKACGVGGVYVQLESLLGWLAEVIAEVGP